MIERTINESVLLKKVRLKDLNNFIRSELYNSLPVKPIPISRAQSYINNPRCDKNDFALYMLLSEQRLIGFRTIFSDYAFIDNTPVKFGWCSGNYIAPDYRRKGYSTILLEEVYNDYNGKLMYTNYAVASHLLYNKSGYFNLINKGLGRRFYGNVNLNELLKGRKLNKLCAFLMPVGNLLIKTLSVLKRRLYQPHNLGNIKISIDNRIPKDFITEVQVNETLFRRTQDIFEWIENYPWLTNDPQYKRTTYPFSLYEKEFDYSYIQITNVDKTVCKLILSVRQGKMKLLYHWGNSPNLAAMFLMNYCYTKKISALTVLDKEIVDALSKLKNPFIFNKAFQMNIFSTFSIQKSDKFKFHDGDGDYIFT